MDQTQVFFSNHSKRTVEKKGSRSVNLRSSKNDSARITVGVTITASGDILSPTIIFKGTMHHYPLQLQSLSFVSTSF